MSEVIEHDGTALSSGPTDAQLRVIVGLARQQVALENEVAKLEKALSDKKKELSGIKERDLPEAMCEAQILNFELTAGWKIELNTTIVAQPTKEQKPAVRAWLDQEGHGDLIKHFVSVQFFKGEDTLADDFLKKLRETFPGRPIVDSVDVNYQTLNAFVREEVPKGTFFPDEFAIRALRYTSIVRPKKEDGL